MSWASVRGHDQVIRQFQHAIARGRLAHAYLLVGPDGIGKKRFALELAKSLLCEQPQPGPEACGACNGCKQVDARTHPDFQLVSLPEDKHEFPVELMQEIIPRLSLKPARGKKRVAIIDDADAFNEESANSFLKTLEEPPPASVLLLIGTSADRQLPTVRSRCQIIRFAPLPDAVITDLLVADGITPNRAEAEGLARRAGGSLGMAKQLADPAVTKLRGDLLRAICQPRIDSVGTAKALNEFIDEKKESAEKRERARLVLGFLVDFLHNAILLNQGRPPQLADPREAEALKQWGTRIGLDALLAALDRAMDAEYQVDRRIQLVLILEAMTDAIGQTLTVA